MKTSTDFVGENNVKNNVEQLLLERSFWYLCCSIEFVSFWPQRRSRTITHPDEHDNQEGNKTNIIISGAVGIVVVVVHVESNHKSHSCSIHPAPSCGTVYNDDFVGSNGCTQGGRI